MKNALISPNETVAYISAWELVGTSYVPIYAVVGKRIAEVVDQSFDVAAPLFWIACNDDVTSEFFYYDTNDKKIKNIPNDAVQPEVIQPVVQGVQSL